VSRLLQQLSRLSRLLGLLRLRRLLGVCRVLGWRHQLRLQRLLVLRL
jgi:hypothetical protein